MLLKIYKYIFWLIFTQVCLISCSLDNNYVKQHEWKYGDGFRLNNDFIAFGGGYLSLRNDTVFILDSAIAVIYDTQKGYFGDDNEIHIKSISTNQKGIYHELGLVKSEDTLVEIILTAPPHEYEPPVPPTPPKP